MILDYWLTSMIEQSLIGFGNCTVKNVIPKKLQKSYFPFYETYQTYTVNTFISYVAICTIIRAGAVGIETYIVHGTMAA